MSAVYQRRQKGTKATVYAASIFVDGKRFLRSTGCTTRREAEKAAVEIERKLREELARRYEPLTLDTLMAKYWEDHAAELPSASSVEYHIKRLLEGIGKNKPLAELSNKDVSDYVAKRKKAFVASHAKDPKKRKPRKPISYATVNRELDVLQAAYCKARDSWEHPVRPINWGDHRLPLPDKEKKTLQFGEAVKAIQLARTKSRDMADAIELSVYTGMRQNELETLIPARVRLEERRVIVLAKRKARQEYRERSVFLNTAAVALLSERITPVMDQNKPIFDLKNGRKIWEWVRAEIGRPDVRWHDLRHTHATLLGRASGDPRIVQRQLGHTHIATSMGYVSTDDAETIAAVEKIAPLTERRIVALGADAGSGTEPPSITAITDVATDSPA
jgi:integrase